MARDVVRVLVIDDGEGVRTFGVEAHEDVVAVSVLEKEAGELEASLLLVSGGLKGCKLAAVLDGEHDDGGAGVGVGSGQKLLKDGLHALELAGNVAGLLRGGVGEDGEVRRGDLEPDGGGVGVGADAEERQGTEGQDSGTHGWPPM